MADFVTMSLEVILLILFGILTSLFALLQLCIATHKYCVWCRDYFGSNRRMEGLNVEHTTPREETLPSPPRSNSTSSSDDSFITCFEETESSL